MDRFEVHLDVEDVKIEKVGFTGRYLNFAEFDLTEINNLYACHVPK